MSEKWLKAETIAKKVVIILILAGACVFTFLLIPQILQLLLPFVIAYIISVIASPLTHLFEKLRLPRTLSAIISILLVAAALFGVSSLVISKIISELYDFSSSIPELYNTMTATFNDFKNLADGLFNMLPDRFAFSTDEVLTALGDSLSAISSSIVSFISSHTVSYVKNIPAFLIAVVFSILASYFLIRDKRIVKSALGKLFGKDISDKISMVKHDLSNAVFAYVKAQGILMSITFVEVFIGLSVIGVKYSFLFALTIAFLDAIPVFGTGTILLPWALISLITGNYTYTISLAILYAVCLVVRQFLEPKILSTQIGMHPLITLLSMYVGFRFIGIFGMILGPVVALIVKNFVERYYIKHNTLVKADK